MKGTRAAVAAAVVAASLALAAAQQPARDTRAANGTGSIAGVVVDETDGRPIARASVTLAGAELRPHRLTIADAAGTFVFTDLPAGRFTLRATRTPYLPSSYGQTEPGRGSGLPLALGDGDRLSDLTVKLARGGVMSGRVLDDAGQPMRGAPVLVFPARMLRSDQMPGDPGGQSAVTDARGEYRVTGLVADEYLIRAFPPGDYRVLLTGPFFPSGPDVVRVTPQEIAWAVEQIRGAGRGDSPAMARFAPVPEPAPGRSVAYGAPYYPNALDPSAATRITLARGEERRGLDIAMRLHPTASVQGTVVGADGQPVPKATVSIGGLTAPIGAFTISGLLPGTYTITARGPANSGWATTDVAVNGEPVTGVVLRIQSGTTISGRVVFDGTSLAAPADASVVRVSLRPASGALPTPAPPISARPDGTFQIGGVPPGRYRLSANLAAAAGAPTGWTLRAAVVGNQDGTDMPFEVRPNEDLPDVVITFTDRTAELSGRLVDEAGRPIPGFHIVLFSTDKSFWIQGSRRVPTPGRSATDGAFRFTGLPPGTYHLAALIELDPSSLLDEAFLARLAASGVTLTIAEGEKKVQDLKVR